MERKGVEVERLVMEVLAHLEEVERKGVQVEPRLVEAAGLKTPH